MALTYVPLSSWIDELAPTCPGAGINAINQALRSTLREFTIDSEAWTRELPAINIVAAQTDYTISESDAQILNIIQLAYFEGTKFKRFITPTTSPASLYANRAPGVTEHFRRYVEDPTVITLIPEPATNVTAALYPFAALTFLDSFDDAKVPSIFKMRWFDAILDGAKTRMFSQQDKPWSNLGMARYHGQRFRGAIARARIEARRQFTDIDQPVGFPLVGITRNNRHGTYGKA